MCITQNIDMDGFSFDVHTLCCLQCIEFQGRIREGTADAQYCVGMTCDMSSPCHPGIADETWHRVGWNASCEMGGLHPGLYRF